MENEDICVMGRAESSAVRKIKDPRKLREIKTSEFIDDKCFEMLLNSLLVSLEFI